MPALAEDTFWRLKKIIRGAIKGCKKRARTRPHSSTGFNSTALAKFIIDRIYPVSILWKYVGRGAARGRGGRRGRPAGTTAKVMAARRYVPHHSTRRLRYTRLKPVGRESFIRYKIDVVLLTWSPKRKIQGWEVYPFCGLSPHRKPQFLKGLGRLCSNGSCNLGGKYHNFRPPCACGFLPQETQGILTEPSGLTEASWSTAGIAGWPICHTTYFGWQQILANVKKILYFIWLVTGYKALILECLH